MSDMTHEEQFVRFILEQLADDINDFSIERIEDDLGVLVKVMVPKQEMGKVIGKNGRHIEAIKTLLKVISAKTGQRTSIKVVEKD